MQKNTCKRHIATEIVLSIFMFLGYLTFFSAMWYKLVYGDVGFDAILFTLFGNTSGVESDLVVQYLINSLLPALLCSGITYFLLIFRSPKAFVLEGFKQTFKIYPLNRIFGSIISLTLSAALIFTACNLSGLNNYIYSRWQTTEIYENYYVSPEQVSINFPGKKRNLIYIYLESMETTFTSKNLGGGGSNNAIPELHNLANENINFSSNDGVGGFHSPYGTTWTTGGMVAQTSGINLNISANMHNNTVPGQQEEFLPGVTSLNDILHDNGYYQTLMVGSDAVFGERKKYFLTHEVDRIYDLLTARQEGFIPKDYSVWWGMEDKKLFDYAKLKLTEIANDTSRPFNFTMLTADTHHIGGYICKDCKHDFSEQYENVLSCSSKHVNDFVEWIKQQLFYENTTIIICGDHPTMDYGYIRRNIDSKYTRVVYNCIINSAISANKSKQRNITSFDLFPTTLASLGCTIEGDRLGLGTNLFSDKDTLLEKFGDTDSLNKELAKHSKYYKEHFLD